MTLSLEKSEPCITEGANWQELEYLIECFNCSGLEGSIVLRRTSMMKNLQLCLNGECCGRPLTVFSEAFSDGLIKYPGEKDRLVGLISRFLLRVTHWHAKISPVEESLTEAVSH